MSTGFTPAQVAATLLRDGGMCALSGQHPSCTGRADTANHRLNRGRGGSKLRNGMANACAICHHCNGLIEQDAEYATLARHLGVKLREGDTPEQIPLWSPFFRQWVRVDDNALRLTGDTDASSRPDLISGAEPVWG